MHLCLGGIRDHASCVASGLEAVVAAILVYRISGHRGLVPQFPSIHYAIANKLLQTCWM